MTIGEFWRSSSSLPRAALVCAAAAAVLNAASYAGLGLTGPASAFGVLHLAIMALGLMLIARTVRHHVLAIRSPDVDPESEPLPKRLVWGTARFLGRVGVLRAADRTQRASRGEPHSRVPRWRLTRLGRRRE